MAKSRSRIQEKKKTRQQRKAHMKRRLKRSGKVHVIVGEIQDPELMTADILKKRRSSPRANITLSGKKKHKILKQLKHLAADSNKMDASPVESQKPTVREIEMSELPRRERRKSASVEMKEVS